MKVLKPADKSEKRQPIPQDFYALLDKNKHAFAADTSPENDDVIPKHKGGANDAYVLKRLKARDNVGVEMHLTPAQAFFLYRRRGRELPYSTESLSRIASRYRY